MNKEKKHEFIFTNKFASKKINKSNQKKQPLNQQQFLLKYEFIIFLFKNSFKYKFLKIDFQKTQYYIFITIKNYTWLKETYI